MDNKKLGIIGGALVIVLVLLVVLFAGTSCSSDSEEPAETSGSGAVQEEQATPIGSGTQAESQAQSGSEGGSTAESSSGGASGGAAESAETPVKVKTKVNLNMRQGPGTNYPVIKSIPQGSEVTVVGRNEDGSWLVVETEDGQGWISGQADFVEADQAAVAGLPAVEAPPAPAYDASNPKVQLLLEQIPLVVYHEKTFTCASHGGLNHLLPEVAEGNVIGPHSGDFVYGNDNVLFQYTGGTFVLIKESSVARFENGEKSLPLGKALELFANGDIVWTGTLGDWPGRGVPGCDPAAKPQ
ncbi:MAG: hypothetical protein D6784_12095 [Chloroflexi bacterium]|nr:MAG: hypothetical protein D6784_12095 [Chloroflexota bacterium]